LHLTVCRAECLGAQKPECLGAQKPECFVYHPSTLTVAKHVDTRYHASCFDESTMSSVLVLACTSRPLSKLNDLPHADLACLQWGSNSRGQLGLGLPMGEDTNEPRRVIELRKRKIIGAAAGYKHTAFLEVRRHSAPITHSVRTFRYSLSTNLSILAQYELCGRPQDFCM